MSEEGSPFFTVVIPVYNRARMIARTLESVYAQDFPDFEVVLVDDGSTDDLEGVAASLSYPRLRIARQENGGASRARNRGIDEARGDYIAFLDSDDTYLPHHLSTMKAAIEGQPGSVVYSPVIANREGGRQFVKPPRAIFAGENMATYLICDRGFVQTSGLCVPADVARRVRYREDARYGDDTDFAIRLQLAGCNFLMTPTPSVVWSDDLDHDRLSHLRRPLAELDWLDDLKPYIPPEAYHGYRGWHLAKSIAQEQPGRALWLYARAVLKRAYSPRLAGVVLMQIVMPNQTYRRLTNWWVEKRKGARTGS
ncbi:glycosyltransferase family 2 protein [Aureimonas sp. ME7]|uniref:glycosyltransferase family 2 protein n=1 Tax=Aureimonas sp. ME7 TaxID=2744252 RepID=UPI0015FA47D3|nr:glycosyltransferase family 2 protein [Aureimonas sp. ME7]